MARPVAWLVRLAALALAAGLAAAPAAAQPTPVRWVTGYYAAYSESLVPGLVPIVAGFVPTAFSGEILRYTFGGGEPAGPYTGFAALTQPGSLALVGPLRQALFTFAP